MTTDTNETTKLDVDQIAGEAARDLDDRWLLNRSKTTTELSDEALKSVSIIIAAAIRRAIQEVVMPAERTEQARLINERDEARAVLKELEWIFDAGPGNPVCPSCEGWKKDGHKSDCKLAKVLNA